VTQEKAKLDSKIKHNDVRIAEGRTEELTEYEYKKMEKEKTVIELRERLQKLKEKVNNLFWMFEKLMLQMFVYYIEWIFTWHYLGGPSTNFYNYNKTSNRYLYKLFTRSTKLN